MIAPVKASKLYPADQDWGPEHRGIISLLCNSRRRSTISRRLSFFEIQRQARRTQAHAPRSQQGNLVLAAEVM
jgi:hypothetical protein